MSDRGAEIHQKISKAETSAKRGQSEQIDSPFYLKKQDAIKIAQENIFKEGLSKDEIDEGVKKLMGFMLTDKFKDTTLEKFVQSVGSDPRNMAFLETFRNTLGEVVYRGMTGGGIENYDFLLAEGSAVNIDKVLPEQLKGIGEYVVKNYLANETVLEKVKKFDKKLKNWELIGNISNDVKSKAYNAYYEELYNVLDNDGIPAEDNPQIIMLLAGVTEKIEQMNAVNDTTTGNVNQNQRANNNSAQEEASNRSNMSYAEYMKKCDEEPWQTRYTKEEFDEKMKKAINLKNRYGHGVEIMKDLDSQLDYIRRIFKDLDDQDDTRSISNSGPFEILDKIMKDNSEFLPEVRQEVSATLHDMRCRYYMAYAGGLVGAGKTRQSIDALMEDIHQHNDFLNRSDWFFLFRDGANGIPFCEMFDLCQLAGYGKVGEGFPQMLIEMSRNADFLKYIRDEKPDFALKAAIRKSIEYKREDNKPFEPDDPIFVNLKGNTDDETIDNLINNWICGGKEPITKTKPLNEYYISEKGLHENYFFDKDEARRIFMGGYIKWKIADGLLKDPKFINKYGDINSYSDEDKPKLMNKAMELSNLSYEHVINFFHTTEEMAIFNVAFGGHDDYREIICWESNQFDRIDKVKVNSADFYLGGEWKTGKRNYFDNTIAGIIFNKTLGKNNVEEKMDKFVYSGKIKSLGTTIVRSIAYKGREAYDKKRAMGVYDGPIKAKDVLVDLIHDEVGKINLYFWYSALLGKKLARLNETLMTRKFKKNEQLLDGDWWQNLVDDCRKATDYAPIGTVYVGEPTEKFKDGNGNVIETELDFKLRRSYGLRLIVVEGIMELLAREMGEKGQSDLMFNAYDIGQLEKLLTTPYYTYENLDKEPAKDKDGKVLLDPRGNQIMIYGRDKTSKISFINSQDFVRIVDKYRGKIFVRDLDRAINNAGHR